MSEDRKTLKELGDYYFALAEKTADEKIKQGIIDAAVHYLKRHADSYLEARKVEVYMENVKGDKIEGDKVEGGKYEISGQAAAVGPESKAEGNVLAQVNTQNSDDINIQELASELSALVNKLREKTAGNDNAPASIEKVVEAQVAAQKGDESSALKSLSEADTIVRSTAEEIGTNVAAKAINKSMLKVATEQERERIIPWVQLGHEAFLITEEKLGGLASERIWQNLERYGICQIRLLAHEPETNVLESVIKVIGFPAEDQNDHKGSPIKDIRPDAEGRPNSGDTTSELGFHVDGTQDSDQPAILGFQYVTGSTLGSHSRFADAAGILDDFDEDTRNEILTTLARSDAATFSKIDMDYTGPIFSYSPTGSLMCRIRFDSVINVHEDCRRAFELLKEKFENNYYSSMFLPTDGDIVVFDNWRVMHARDEIYGTRQRHHRRVWIALPRHEHQIKYKLGIRPISKDIAARIVEANKS